MSAGVAKARAGRADLLPMLIRRRRMHRSARKSPTEPGMGWEVAKTWGVQTERVPEGLEAD